MNVHKRAPPAPGYDGFYQHDVSALQMAVEYIYGSGVSGDLVEFGCYAGRTAEVLAQSMLQAHMAFHQNDVAHGLPDRHLWLFDSFEGFPEASDPVDAASPHIQAKIWRAGIPQGSSPERVAGLCRQYLPEAALRVVKGWYKDTLEQIPASTTFALVHMDCDYYESTVQVLQHLFYEGLLSDGCTILFDDWYCNRGSPRFGQQRAWRYIAEGPLHGYGITDWGPYGVVGRRFIVHV